MLNSAAELKELSYDNSFIEQSLDLHQWTLPEAKDRKWLASKLLEPTEEDAETKRQQEYVKESLTRSINEVKAAKRGEHKLMTEEVLWKD